jgi:hypothetical protein
MLEHREAEATAPQVSREQRHEGAVRGEIGAQQHGADGGSRLAVEQWLQQGRRGVDDDQAVAGDGGGGRGDLETSRAGRNRDLAQLAAGGDLCIRQMHRQPLLQALRGR